MNKKSLSIIIPCYNEGKNLDYLIQNIKKSIQLIDFDLEIILVNNGSSDDSKDILNKLIINETKIKILHIDVNVGYGHGILKGLAAAKYDYLCWTHADLQCDFNDCLKGFVILFNKINIDKKNYILKGNRKKRRLVDMLFTKLMSIFIKVFCRINLNDVNAQPKIFSKKLYEKFKNPPNDFLLDFYFMYLSQKEKYEIINYDVDFKDRKFGEAKGGGSLFGKIKLSFKTAYYIIKYTYGNNNTQS